MTVDEKQTPHAVVINRSVQLHHLVRPNKVKRMLQRHQIVVNSRFVPEKPTLKSSIAPGDEQVTVAHPEANATAAAIIAAASIECVFALMVRSLSY